MGFGGLVYGGMFPVVMLNSVLCGFGHIVSLLEFFFRVTGLRRPGAYPEERAQNIAATSGDRHFVNSMGSIAEEIRRSLTSCSFDPMTEEFVSRGCAVCLSELEIGESVVQLPHCSHIFHKECVGKWLDFHQTTCPLCRSSFLTVELSIKLTDHDKEELADASSCGNYGWNRFY